MSASSDTELPRNRCAFHWPKAYRYLVANPGLRGGLNRYPGTVIGAYLVAGRYAYCLKWGWAKVITP